MIESQTSFRVADISAQDGYKLATGIVVPRPIGWIGTVSASGLDNLAPYSFFNVMSGDPVHVVFSPGGGARKDTLDNVREVGEFTVNVVTAETVEAMNATSATLPADEDEFEHASITKLSSVEIGPCRVAEATATMECVVTDIVHVGHKDGGNHLVIGEAVMIHVANRVLDGTRILQDELRAIGRHAGSWYSNATDLFSIERPS
ncbi:MAG: flavin reductase family protein [Acidimicrobiaceae bacterium]|jgi:flavin reductase (DIM6/NTAB) family NADH-FMN oxidoreductase RutF|nr:flavin reductase family protein [Acidimicrobiaceae bacterium]MBT5579553.1 flavin reductase family protein [Acidimicrobiaceae bacterium]